MRDGKDRQIDKLNRYRHVVKQIVNEYAVWFPHDDDVQTKSTFAPERDHYELLRVGWKDESRIHHSAIHLNIINGKVWIRHDGTNRPSPTPCSKPAAPHEDIVLGFHPPDVRQYTEFAAA